MISSFLNVASFDHIWSYRKKLESCNYFLDPRRTGSLCWNQFVKVFGIPKNDMELIIFFLSMSDTEIDIQDTNISIAGSLTYLGLYFDNNWIFEKSENMIKSNKN